MPVLKDLPPRPGTVNFSEREMYLFNECARHYSPDETNHDISYDDVVEAAGHCALFLVDNGAREINTIKEELLGQISAEGPKRAFEEGFSERLIMYTEVRGIELI